MERHLNLFAKVDAHLATLFALEDEALKNTAGSIRNAGMPEHSVSAGQGQLLFLLAKMCKAIRIVEIGTLGGYSTIWLARALEGGGKITSIEIDAEYAQLARKNIRKAGLSKSTEIITGNGIEQLEKLGGTNGGLDLFFMDADKPNYINYFNWAIKNVRPGGLIIADNVIREGKILDKSNTDEKVSGVRNYLEMLAAEHRVTTSILPTIGQKEYDGIAISLVKQ